MSDEKNVWLFGQTAITKINTQTRIFFFSFSHNGGHDANIKYGDKRKKNYEKFPTYSFQPRKISATYVLSDFLIVI